MQSQHPPLTPGSARNRTGSNAGGGGTLTAPLSSRGTFRNEPVSERRSSRSGMRDGAQSSVARSARVEMETPTRSRQASFSARRNTVTELVQAQGNAMRVYVRVRPYSERELAQKDLPTHSAVRIDAENSAMITVLDPNRDFRPVATYKFTNCFWSVFERSTGDLQRNRTMADMRDSVDTYLNGGMNSGRTRPRAMSLSTQPSMSSARGKAGEGSTVVAPAYLGSGSNAAMVDANVSHPPYAGQLTIYETVGKPVLANTLEGYNGCVFAYGQTGSGKTFTMMGYAPAASEFRRHRKSLATTSARAAAAAGGGEVGEMESFSSAAFDRDESMAVDGDEPQDVVVMDGNDPIELMGIIPRVTADLFSGLNTKRDKDPSWSYRVEVTYYEIYNEKVFDLIKTNRASELKIRNNPTSGPYVDGLEGRICNKEEDVMRIIRNGMLERHTAATKFNDRSSRSHAILNINILQLAIDDSDNTLKMQSKLNLVDLAGSERAGAAGSDRPEFREGVNINLSLTVLGRVIDCLADLSQNKSLAVPVPYRDSTLTLLLMDSIGGNSQTSMIATVSPHAINYEEMKQTLRYASRATVIVNRAVINEDPQQRQIKLLTGEVERLHQLLKEAGGSEYTREDIRAMKKKIEALERKVAEQERVIAGLRAELERAGIADPTLDESFAEGGDSRAAQDRRREEALKKKHDAMHADLISTRAELERRAKIEPEQVAHMKKTIEKQGREIAQLRLECKAASRLSLLYTDRTMSDLTNAFGYIEKKENGFFQSCWAMLQAGNTSNDAILAQMRRDNEQALRNLAAQHSEDGKEQEERNQRRLEAAAADNLEAQRELVRKHKEALDALSAHMQRSRDVHEAERKQLHDECDQLRRQAADASSRAREAYQQDLEKLRTRLEAEAANRRDGGSGDGRLTAEQQAKEIERLTDEMERVKRVKEQEISRLRQQLENEQLRRESDLMEKERQRRQVDAELAQAKRDMLELQAEKARMEREYQEQIRDLVRQQDELISISNSVLGDWEGKSSDLEGQMCKLRALIYDKDYMNFRSKMRDLAFAERTDLSKELTDIDERKRRDAEALRSIKNKLRKTQEDQQTTYEKIRQQVVSVRPGGRTPRPENGSPTASAAASSASASATNGNGSSTNGGAKPGGATTAPPRRRAAAAAVQ